MAVPKKKKSSSKRDMRRAQHDKVAEISLSNCPQCFAPKLPHRICTSCGFYKDRTVVEYKDAKDAIEAE